MKTIEVFGENIEIGSGHSSKGNQMKWEQDGWWYKADAFGYESLAETVISRLLKVSSLYAAPEHLVEYEPVNIKYKGETYRGCRSRNFRAKKEELVPLERLYRSHTGFGLAKQLAHIYDVKERIRHTEELVRNVTGMEDFGIYLAKLLEIDAFFLNEDRHTNNIALLYDTVTKKYRLCPFFDMGLSLFSNTREEYPFEKTFQECREKICAKPFSRDFDEQLDVVNELYGCHLKFDFSAGRITDVLEELRPECSLSEREDGTECGYTEQEFKRVEEVLRYQAGKYKYMFAS